MVEVNDISKLGLSPIEADVFFELTDLDGDGKLTFNELTKANEWYRMWMRMTAASGQMASDRTNENVALRHLLDGTNKAMDMVDQFQKKDPIGIGGILKSKNPNPIVVNTIMDLNDVYVTASNSVKRYLREKVHEKLKNLPAVGSAEGENINAIEMWATAIEFMGIWSSIVYCDGEEGLSRYELEDLRLFGPSMSPGRIEQSKDKSNAALEIEARVSLNGVSPATRKATISGRVKSDEYLM